MASITLDDKNLKKKLATLIKKMADATPAFRDIADLEWAQTRFRYIKEVDPEGSPWPVPFTVRRDGGVASRAQGKDPWAYVIASNYHAAPPGYHFFDSARGDKILRDTGTLFNSIGRDFGPTFAIVGTNMEYAEKNQNGDGVKKRAFLGINRKTEQNVRQVLTSYLSGALK